MTSPDAFLILNCMATKGTQQACMISGVRPGGKHLDKVMEPKIRTDDIEANGTLRCSRALPQPTMDEAR